MPRLANAEDLMPWYERTGMISHRHPFYGVGYFADEGDANPFTGENAGPWAPPTEPAAWDPTAGPNAGPWASQAAQQQTVAEQMGPPKPSPTPSGSSMIIPLLLGVAALLIFTGTLNLGSKPSKRR